MEASTRGIHAADRRSIAFALRGAQLWYRAALGANDYITQSTWALRSTGFLGFDSPVTSQSCPLYAQSDTKSDAPAERGLPLRRSGLTQVALTAIVTHRVPIQPSHCRAGPGRGRTHPSGCTRHTLDNWFLQARSCGPKSRKHNRRHHPTAHA